MNYRSVATLSHSVSVWLERLPHDWDLIVGIPRSGLLPASLIALQLNVPIADLSGFIAGRTLCSGRRGRRQISKGNRKVLVIDDSVNTGGQISQAREQISAAGLTDDIFFAAVYVTPGAEGHIDFWHEQLESPRVFEWNIMHHALLMSSCLNIDGVLCRGPSEAENNDAKTYADFLENAEPKFLPSVPVGWLVTSRLEKYRTQTEAWMAKHRIDYRELIMMPAERKAPCTASRGYAEHKARAYMQTGADLFIESSVVQSVEIAALSGKPVFCVEILDMVYSEQNTPVLLDTSVELTTAMPGNNTRGTEPSDWAGMLQLSVREILHTVPAGDSFVLIDDDKLGMHRVFAGRKPVPLPEQDGHFAGPPADCESALRELHRIMKTHRPSRLVVAWPAFWWRDYYPLFMADLTKRYPVLLNNSRLLVLDLTVGRE